MALRLQLAPHATALKATLAQVWKRSERHHLISGTVTEVRQQVLMSLARRDTVVESLSVPTWLVRCTHCIPTWLMHSTHYVPTWLVRSTYWVPTWLVRSTNCVPTWLVRHTHRIPTWLVRSTDWVATWLVRSTHCVPTWLVYSTHCVPTSLVRGNSTLAQLWKHSERHNLVSGTVTEVRQQVWMSFSHLDIVDIVLLDIVVDIV